MWHDLTLTPPLPVYEKPEEEDPLLLDYYLRKSFRFGFADNYRDVWCEGDCDLATTELATLLGWHDELQALCSSKALDNSKHEEEEQKSAAELACPY